jgi:hypothetical protein
MKVLLFLLFFEPTQQLNKPEQLVSNFYEWYVNNGYLEMKPTFKELENGMTDMDFRQFNEAHKRFAFSEDLVGRSRLIYSECRNNLSKVPYAEFIENHDLDYDEMIDCDFQYWQWFGMGMEAYQYFELTEAKKLNDEKYEITVGLSWRKDEPLTLYIPVTVERTNSKWEITNIGVEWE